MDTDNVERQESGFEVAIIGLSGRFPGARNADEFWQNIRNGQESISFFSAEELLATGIDPALIQDPAYVRANGTLEDVELFDAAFFGYSPREAETLDPQQRLFLECSAEAFENAGYDPKVYPGLIGVYAGSAISTYFLNNIYPHRSGPITGGDLQELIANDKDFLATRVSYKLNLRGPGIVVQTACSTALTAIHLACQGLISGECHMALAGGVSIRVPQIAGYRFQEGAIFSSDGHCRSFDARANGTVFSNGVGVVVLKLLEDAIADRDHIHGVIKGSAINNDGSLKAGYTAPSIQGQTEVIKAAHRVAGVRPGDISYVETHGTGTPIGDPIEIAALIDAFASPEKQVCALGSVKTNVGHLDTAAGMAGLFKTLYALKYRELPPSLHFDTPNPALNLDDSPFYVNQKLIPWDSHGKPRRAGISSFGIGGTNAHIIVEEAPVVATIPSERPWHALILSARTESALQSARQNMLQHLQKHAPTLQLADVAYTLQVGRPDFNYRLALVCQNVDDAVQVLQMAEPARLLSAEATASHSSVAFLFPGQGSQYVQMGQDLYQHELVFREQVDHCAKLLIPLLGIDLRTVLYPTDATSENAVAQINQTALTQPVLFVIEYALAKLWLAWGIRPAALIGHSIGEYVAACLAGVLPLEAALSLVAVRGRLMQQLQSGAMLAVPLSDQELQPLLAAQLSIAAINTPQQCVASGPEDAIEHLAQQLQSQGIDARRLRTSHAFHSAMVEPVLATFAQQAQQIQFQAPQIPYISNVTGTWITPAQATNPDYWVQHLRHTVRFSEGIQTLLAHGEASGWALIEVGPGHTLSTFVRQQTAVTERKVAPVIVSSLRGAKETQSDTGFLLTSLARLWLSGVHIEWANLYAQEKRQRVPLPTYPFERQRYWIEPIQYSTQNKQYLAPYEKAEDIVTDQPAEQHGEGSTYYARPQLSTLYMAPRNEVEQAVTSIWQEMLGIERIGIYDNFLDLGGHSLLATQIVSRLRSVLQIEVPLRDIFETMTVAELAERINTTSDTEHRLLVPALTPVSQEERQLLSFGQQRIWFFDQLEPGNTFYNIAAAIQLQGHLNISILERSLQALLAHHDVLRTTFHDLDGQPTQLVAPTLTLALPIIDFQELVEDERKDTALRLATHEAQRPFSLTQGPLVRITVLRMEQQTHILLLTLHHIVADGWSLALLIRELSEIYTTFASAQPLSLAELPIQYGDYAAWQRQWLQSIEYDRQLAYWKMQLAGNLPLLELPLDHPRPAIQTYHGAHQTLYLPQGLANDLQALSRQEDVTLFMTLLAAFQVLLACYTGQKDILVGTPVASRNRAEIEDVVGFFVNTLVLRTDLADNPSFVKLLQRVREVCLDAYAHQDMPFERLVEALQPERDLSRSPLFQIMFAQQNMATETIEFMDLSLTPLETENGIALFDLTLSVGETEQGVCCWVEYNTDLFEASTIQRLLRHWQTLLTACVHQPAAPISDLSLLSIDERQQILFTWNATQQSIVPPSCLHELIQQQVARSPEAIALVFEHEQLSYQCLNARANQLARHLRLLGVGPEVPVGICLPRSLDLIIGLLAILKAGGAYVPLDPGYPTQRLAYLIEDAHVPLLLTNALLRAQLSLPETHVLCLSEVWSQITQFSVEDPDWKVLPENLAYIIYTSGSTGRPKGTLIQHQSIVNHNLAISRRYQLQPADRVLQFASISFDVAAEEIFPTLLSGATLILRPDILPSPRDFLQLVAHEQLTVLNLPPAYWHEWVTELAQSTHISFIPLRLVVVGSEAVLTEKLTLWQQISGDTIRWLNAYGPTEATITSSIYKPQKLSSKTNQIVVPIGQPIAHLQMYVLNTQLQPVPIGIAGELYIGGAGLARGYLNQPALTAERFLPDPFSGQEGARLYRTGDLARYQDDGNLQYLGRMDEQVKLRGYRIELGEIEAVLQQHPAVHTAVVIVHEDEEGDKRLVAYLIPANESAPTTSVLGDYLQKLLPSYMIPAHFQLLEQLPITSSGKIDRRALAALELRGEERESTIAAHTPFEEIVSQLWCQILSIQHIGLHDNFFMLGGHSLLATRMIGRLRSLLGVELPLRSLFEAPTVAGLSRYIEDALRSPSTEPLPALEPLDRKDKLAPSFAQQRLWFLDQLEPGSATYIIPAVMRIEGELHAEMLERSLDEIVCRHESLRTSFQIHNGQPVQIIAPERGVGMRHIILHNQEATQRETQARLLIQQEAMHPFDLHQGPLIRATLLHLSEQEHILCLTLHHIVADGGSIDIVVHELCALYAAFVAGAPSPLAELTIQYADYASWQRSWLQGSLLERLMTYWKRQLAHVQPLELPTDAPRPAEQRYQGHALAFHLPSALSTDLKALSQQAGTTLFMTLLASFQLLLARWSGQDDITVGSPIANRTDSQLETLIGFFANTMVLRTDLSGNPSFLQLLQRVREVCLGAYAHQDMPFEHLVEEIQPQRDLSRSPLFQVLFVLQQATPLPPMLAAGLSWQPLLPEQQTAKFDLTWELEETVDGLQGWVEYNTDLFTASTIQRWLQHWQTLLTACVQQPEAPICALPLLSTEQRQQILGTWNATQVDYPAPFCLHALIQEQVACSPQAIALVFEDEQLSYQCLNARANQLARHLRLLGVGPEVPVGICLPRSLDLVVGLLAILKAGGAYVPLDPGYPAQRLAYLIADARVPLLLTTQPLRAQLPLQQTRVLCFPEVWSACASLSTTDPDWTIHPDSLAYIIYTSGSTGQPKGAMNTHRGIVNRLRWMQQTYQLTGADRVVQKTPFSFDVSVWEFFWPLLSGARLVVALPEGHRDPQYLAALLHEQAITTIHFVPSMLQLFLQEPALPTYAQSLRRIICSGEALPVEVQERCLRLLGSTAQVYNLYGPTEAAVDVTAWHCRSDQAAWTVPIGLPIANLQIYLLDPQMQPVPIGVPGELYIGGVGVGRGYWQRGGLTAERFIPDPFSQQTGARLYRSGDLACYREDGRIEYTGRIDEQVKLRGYRIELGEIETVLAQHPTVRATVLQLREDATGNKRLVAYVIPEAENAPTANELVSYLQGLLPSYMIPAYFLFLEQLPVTPNGKIDRRALPAPDWKHSETEGTFIAPRTYVEEVLAGIWANVLGIKQVSIRDNFFALGGDSILSIQIVARATQVGLQLTARQLFQHQTIEDLSAVVTSQAIVRAEQNTVVGPLPLTPIQRWFFTEQFADPHHWNHSVHLEVPHHINGAHLNTALSALLMHHDALRLRFTQSDAGWQQSNADRDDQVPFFQVDLSSYLQIEQDQVITAIETSLQTSLDLAEGPLLRVVLFELGATRSDLLLIVVHHLVVDGISWRILLEDLQTAYQQVSQGATPHLPFKTTAYKEWAERLLAYAQSDTPRQERAYWLADTHKKVKPLPLDYPAGASNNTVASTRTVTVSLTRPETQLLLERLPQLYHVQINDVLLTAFALTLAQWTGSQFLHIDMEAHGREEILEEVNISRTVGWFTALYPLLLNLEKSASEIEALHAVQEQLKQVPNHGIGYGILRYLSAETDLTSRLEALPQSQAVFNYFGQFDQLLTFSDLFGWSHQSTELNQSPRGMRTHVLEVNSIVRDNIFQSTWSYSEELHLRSTIDHLASTFLRILRTFITQDQASTMKNAIALSAQLETFSQERLQKVCVELGLEEHEELGHEIESIDPLTSAQLGMLYETIRTPESSKYIEQLMCTLTGDFNLEAFKRAWQREINRHSILRTGFVWETQAEPLQVVLHEVAPAFEYYDWCEYSPARQATLREHYLEETRSSGFSLVRPPLMRVAIFKTAQATYQLVWTWHHLVMDGWSYHHVLKEVLSCYQAFCHNQTLQLEPSRPYRDYVAWLAQRPIAEEELFWRKALQRVKQPTPLGKEGEPGSFTEQHERYRIAASYLSKQTTEALRAVARKHHLTLNTLMQGTWALLLSRYSGADDVLFGITVSGRPAELTGIETMVGLYINTLPMVVQVPQTTSLWTWLAALQDYNIEMRQYEYSSGEQIHQWSNIPGGLLLYESLLVVENFPVDLSIVESSALNVAFSNIALHGAHTNYALTILVTPRVEHEVECIYDTRRFHPADVERIARHFQAVLERMATDPIQEQISTYQDLIPLDQIPTIRAYPRVALTEEQSQPIAAGNPIEELLAGIWREVLGLEHVDLHSNFFEMGGHSLLATQLVSRLRSILGLEISLRTLFEAPTIKQLAERISSIIATKQGREIPPIVPVSRDSMLPLAFAQQRLWFLHQLTPDNPSYHICRSLHLLGALHAEALQQSLAEIIQRQEGLRTNFVEIAGQVVQVISPHSSLLVPVLDLRTMSELEKEAEVARLTNQTAHTCFDLSQGPLLRIHLLRLNDEEHRLLLVIHHIVFDVWSESVLLHELSVLYENFVQGKPSTLPTLAIQYADFAAWQHAWLQGDVLAQQVAYWQKQLADAPPLELPTDRPRSAQTSFAGAALPFELSPQLTERLVLLSQQEGVTLFMTLLAAYQILLYRYTNQEDIVVGTDIANRTRTETEALIGFFVNLLALRTDLSGHPRFREVLQQVREVVLNAYTHQDMPFEKLVETLQLKRTVSQTSLVRTLFVFQNIPMQPLQLPGLTVRPVEVELNAVNFDLVVFMWKEGDRLVGLLNYSSELFDISTITHMIKRFERLLQSAVAQPETRINALEIHTASEKQLQSAKKAQQREARRHKLKLIERTQVDLPDLE